jgi:ATP-binding cassette subfamily B (MDR/TAP) protein 1
VKRLFCWELGFFLFFVYETKVKKFLIFSIQMSKESEEIKTSSTEQWKWSEMQGLELVNEDNNSYDPFKGNLPTVIEEGQVSMVETSGGSGKEEKVVKSVPAVGFGELFRFADGLDYILMTIGTVGAIVHGCSLPIFLRFFADLVNSFGSNANNLDKMTQEVVKVKNYH